MSMSSGDSARRLCVGLSGQGFEVYAFLDGVCIMGGEFTLRGWDVKIF